MLGFSRSVALLSDITLPLRQSVSVSLFIATLFSDYYTTQSAITDFSFSCSFWLNMVCQAVCSVGFGPVSLFMSKFMPPVIFTGIVLAFAATNCFRF